MTTVDTDQLTETIESLQEAAKTALANESSEDFESFERYLSEVDGFVREMQQSAWADEAKATIRRLEKGDPLSAQDQALLRTFLISDAQAYLQEETNYGEWVRELQRLVGELSKRANTVTRDSIAELRGILKDAVRLVPDIRNYLDEKRRVEKFEGALTTLDKSSRDLLVRVLRESLRSEKR